MMHVESSLLGFAISSGSFGSEIFEEWLLFLSRANKSLIDRLIASLVINLHPIIT